MDSPESTLTAWARRVLEVPDGTPPEQARGGLLRRLGGGELVPPPDWHEAAEVLCRTQPGRPPATLGLMAEETRLREEVQSFAADFFQTRPAERRQRWHALGAQCRPFPPLAARLRELAPGLDVEPACLGDRYMQVNRLAARLAQLFVLPLVERAKKRRELFEQMREAGWLSAARRLQSHYPAVAALEPHLLTAIITWPKTDHAIRKARAKMQRPASGSSSGAGKGVGVGVGVAAMVIIRLIATVNSNSNHSTPSYSPAPAYQYSTPRVPDPWAGGAPWTGLNHDPDAGSPTQPPVYRPGENSFEYQKRLQKWAEGQNRLAAPPRSPAGVLPGSNPWPGARTAPGWPTPPRPAPTAKTRR